MLPLGLSTWLEHLAATAVSGGFLTALALVCLVQYIWHVAIVRRFQQAGALLQQRVHGLELEIARAWQHRARSEHENGLLRQFLTENNADIAIDRLLRQFVPTAQPAPTQPHAPRATPAPNVPSAAQADRPLHAPAHPIACAAILLHTPAWTLRRAIGLHPEPAGEIHVDPEILDRLRHQPALLLTGDELARSRLWHSLAPGAPPPPRLYVVRIARHGEPLDGFVVATQLPQDPGQAADPVEFAAGLLAAVGPHLRRTASLSAQAQELRLTREILELRSIVDAEYRSPRELTQEFLARLAAVGDFDQAGVHLLRPRDSGISLLARHQAAAALAEPELWIAAEDELVRIAVTQGQLEHHAVESLDALLDARPPFAEAVTVPMQFHGATLGVLALARRAARPLSPSEVELLTWAAEYLFDIILKTADRALTEDRARRDALTGLANRHAFESALDEQLRRAFRTGRDCSLLLFDIDRFKSINDSYGHLAGDETLRVVSQALRDALARNLRGTDHPLAARYGGEELAVIVPGMGLAGALRLAEAIREQIEQTPITYEGTTFHATLSGGVTVAPEHSRSIRGIIAAADEALYRAKQAGRNCILAALPRNVAAFDAAPREGDGG